MGIENRPLWVWALKIAALIRSFFFFVLCSLTPHHLQSVVWVCAVWKSFTYLLKLPSPQLVSPHLAHSPRTSTPSSCLETEKLFGFIVLIHSSAFQPTLPSAHFAVCARSVSFWYCIHWTGVPRSTITGSLDVTF